ncbi:MAG: peroxiredoxin [bacterium]
MVGKKVPDFTLKDQDENTVKLSSFKGQWVVLYFYPKDDTPGCTREAIAFTEDNPDFRNLDAVILGVSRDSCQSHRKFIVKYNLGITLLSDPDHTVMEKYGAWGEKTMYGKTTEGTIRSTVLIDPSGIIVHLWPKVTVDGHAEAVKAKLKELRG